MGLLISTRNARTEVSYPDAYLVITGFNVDYSSEMATIRFKVWENKESRESKQLPISEHSITFFREPRQVSYKVPECTEYFKKNGPALNMTIPGFYDLFYDGAISRTKLYQVLEECMEHVNPRED